MVLEKKYLPAILMVPFLTAFLLSSWTLLTLTDSDGFDEGFLAMDKVEKPLWK